MQSTSKSVNNHRTQKVVVSDLLAGKWTIPVICTLGKGTLRYNAIEKALPSITQRALTIALRNLERSGILDRYVYPSVPPQVEYKLTSLGLELLHHCGTLNIWTKEHEADIQRARKSYARRSR